MIRTLRWALVVAVVAVHAAGAAQPAPSADLEAATARRFAAILHAPGSLRAFLQEMPKGGDLHNHLSGGIYAESFVRWSVDDKLCLVVQTMAIAAAPCDLSKGRPLLSDAIADAGVYGQVIDSLSMRHWDPRLNGHDHFFAAFAKFGPAGGRFGDMVAEAASRAAAEHVSYLELMMNVDAGAGGRLAAAAGAETDFARLRDRLLAAGFKDQVLAAARSRVDMAEARKNEVLNCGRRQADAGCGVTIRYIHQVLRTSAPEQAFGQMLAGFEIAASDPRVVAVNPVQPEDDPTALRDFSLQMRMFELLHGLYPSVPLTLHAGELTDGLVPPAALRFHIRQSVEIAHAQRIGHGVSVMSEDDPFGLLREMAARHVLVEIALTSNDVILGVRGPHHPLTTYLKYGVPVALVTDDAGVSRSSHTLEFVKAVEDHGLDYRTLKRMVRNSIEYAFVDAPTKARLRAQLEESLRAFERKQARASAPAD